MRLVSEYYETARLSALLNGHEPRGRYLYESEMYTIAKAMVEQAVSTFENKTSLEYASAIDLGGLIDLDLAQPCKALERFKQALEIRKASLGPEDPFIAYSLNNMALAYCEMGELDSPSPRTKRQFVSGSRPKATGSATRTATCRVSFSAWVVLTRPKRCLPDAHP